VPAITAVFLYSLLPIMRNTYLALTGNVERRHQVKRARGIGMTVSANGCGIVELPLAVPVILGWRAHRRGDEHRRDDHRRGDRRRRSRHADHPLRSASSDMIETHRRRRCSSVLLAIVADLLLQVAATLADPEGTTKEMIELRQTSPRRLRRSNGKAGQGRRLGEPDCRRRRNLRVSRPVGLRQDHHVEDDQPSDRADFGQAC
jgi:hypothetical protein